MVSKFSNFFSGGAALTAIVLCVSTLLARNATAEISAPCTEDDSACKQLPLDQHGVDPKSGVHFVLELNLKSGQPRQSATLELYIAKSKSECGGNLSRTLANIDPGSSGYRSMDGYLCRLRATWLRR